MPLILVVDRDERVPGRVRSALGDEGWTVAHVKDVTQAMHSVASEAPELFLVSADLPNAEHVLSSFARRQGGPGTIALAPDGGGGDGASGAPDDRGQDLTLPRSFSDADLRAAIGRILETGDRPSRPQTDEPKLTSHDIFGDLVAEVEREEAPPRPAARPPSVPRARTIDDDMERKLEQTLSGVLGPMAKRPAAPAAPPAAPPPPARTPRRSSDDVDKMISDTLSGLEQRPAPRRRPAPADDPFDLSDLEALLDRPKKAPRPAAPPAPPAPAASGPPPAPDSPRLPPAALSIPPKPEEVPFVSLFAEEMREVPDAVEEEGAEAEAPSSATAGGDFGQYRLLDRIGVGGMAEVWKARMTGVEGFQKTVAIKRILPHLTDSTDFVEMFIDEAKLAAQLNHANIIHIYDLGKLGDDYYIAMEYVEGENLRGILNRARERAAAVPEGVALYVAARLASALDYAHRQRDFDDRELGLVHRDVSPQNVLIGYEGTIKLCDFGIVKAVSKSSHTQMGALKGKLQYMSPEQAYGKPVDGRSDIFAVGALLFEMLTGRRLFVGDSEMEVLEAVRECRVVAPSELAPSVRPEVDAVVRKALAREPGERFQSAGEMVRRLEEILASMRPVPGQRELSVFMARLFDRAVEEAEEPAPEPLAPAVPEPPAAVPSPSAAPEPPPAAPPEDSIGPWLDEPPAEDAADRPSQASGKQPPVEALAPVGPAVDPEEGGRRGKGLLVAAIVTILVLGGLLAWYLVQRRSGVEDPAVVPVESERAAGPAVPGAGSGTGEEPEPADGLPAGADAAEAEAAETEPGAGAQDAAGDEALGDDDITQIIDQKVEEELARREEILRRQFEEEEQRIQRQLRALEQTQREEAEAAEQEEPVPAPPPRP